MQPVNVSIYVNITERDFVLNWFVYNDDMARNAVIS